MQWIDQPGVVRRGEELDRERLLLFLREQLPEINDGPLETAQFGGGFSNLTYLLRLGDRELVLRRPPFGAQIRSGHDMAREYRILSGLIDSYPQVPRPLLYSDDPAIIGAPFYLMERVRGVILRNPLPPDLAIPPDHMQVICHRLIDTLAALHRFDYAAASLADLGKPDGYTARQVRGWSERYHAARTDDLPAMERTAAWLQSNIPARHDAALIHNDYRYDNVVLDPDDLTRIVAILDWELATLGDPLTDVGTTLAYWAEPNDPPELRQFGITSLPGNLDRHAWLQRYAEQSGRDVENILFYFVYGLFKNGVILQQIYTRYRKGLTTDARFAGLLHVVRVNAELAQRAIAIGRIDSLY